jgi:hypothetical protein
MVVGSRRRAIAAAASALLALALAVAIAGRGCRAEDETPEGAVRAFFSAVAAGDRAAVHDLLGPRTRAHLEKEAQHATELVGGSRRLEARELLGVSAAGGERSTVRDILLKERDGDTAIVEIVDADGERWPITVVEVDGHWRVELVDAVPGWGDD